MRQWTSQQTFAAMLVGVLGGGGLGCVSPGSQRIIGPDGTPMAHVHCGSEQGICFRIAGELCPTGYELKPVLSGNDGNFLVRCRAPRPIAQVAPACSSVASAPPPSAPPTSLMYPWPPPESGTAAVQRQPSPSTSPATEIDLGY